MCNKMTIHILFNSSQFQANALESKANRIQHDLSHNNLNVEAWLLARQTMAGTGKFYKLG